MSGPEPGHDPLGGIADSFLARLRRGERPPLAEYAGRYPELADEIRELFPALVELERFGATGDEPTGPLSSAPPRGDEAPPARLGDYRIIRRVGEGGMGIVYEAVRESLGSHVALKVIRPRFRADAEYLRRFRTEASSAARLNHGNIVPVFDFGEHDGVCYYAMQFIQGQGLDRVLAEVRRLRQADPTPVGGAGITARGTARALLTGRFDPGVSAAPTAGPPPSGGVTEGALTIADRDAPAPRPEGAAEEYPSVTPGSLTRGASGTYFVGAARLAAQVADALDYAHKRGVLHRDIKPSNLLVDALGNAWVTDFGLAKFDEGGDVSQSREVVGTLRFMAPERFRGDSDRRGDVYALGATLYEMLTLGPAFAAVDHLRLIDQILHETPAPPRRADRRVPRDLETIVLKAMAKAPVDRFATAGDMARELERFVEGRPIRSRRIPPAERVWRWCRRNPAVAALVFSVALLLVSIAVGSSVAAKRLRGQLAKTSRAEVDAREKLRGSYLDKARAVRNSAQVGRRFDALDALGLAAAIRPDPTMRDEAIASLALVDLRPVREWNVGQPRREFGVAVDAALERYVRSDEGGGFSVRRVPDDAMLLHIPEVSPAAPYFAFSPDGRYLFNGYPLTQRPRNYEVWDLESGRRIDGLPEVMTAFDFRPGGGRLALGLADGSVIQYDLPGAALAGSWNLGTASGPMAFDAEGRRIAVVSRQTNEVRVCDPATGRVARTFPHPNEVTYLAWRPDGKLLAAACVTKIYVWDTATGALVSVLDGHQSGGIRLGFSPGGDLLASSAWDGMAGLWDPVTGRRHLELAADFLRWGPDGRTLALAQDRRVVVYEVGGGEFRSFDQGLVGNRTVPRLSGPWRVEFSPDGRLLASADPADGVRIFRAADGKDLAHLAIGPTESLVFQPDGALVTYNGAGLLRWPVRVRSRGTGRVGPPERIDLPPNPNGLFRFVACDGRGGSLAVTDRTGSGKAVLVDSADPRQQKVFGPHPGINLIALSPDGRWLATGTWRGADVKVWDTLRGTLAHQITSGDAHVGFSPDGRWLVTGELESCRFFEVGSWKPGPVVPTGGVGSGVRPFAFRPDGLVFVTTKLVGRRDMLVLVDPASGREFAALQPPETLAISWIRFSPDGARLAAATVSHRVQVWDLRRLGERLSATGLGNGLPPLPSPPASGASEPPVALTVDPGGISASSGRLARATELIDAREWEAAVRELDEALLGDPRDTSLYHLRAECQLKLRRWGRAAADYTEALRLKPDLTAANNALAWLYLVGPREFRHPDLAARLAERAVKSRPDDVGCRNTLGLAYYRTGEFARSVEVLEINTRKEHVFFGFDLLFLAMSRGRLGQADRARKDLDSALRWRDARSDLDAESAEEFGALRAEAEAVVYGKPLP